jgi:phosphoenolpyruvate carboxylase
MELVRADLDIAAHYDELATGAATGFVDAIRREHALAKRWITWIKGEVDLLDSRPPMQRSVLLRAPYLDPMHLMQIDLLRRWRAGERADRELLDALLASVTGIALGLQATG